MDNLFSGIRQSLLAPALPTSGRVLFPCWDHLCLISEVNYLTFLVCQDLLHQFTTPRVYILTFCNRLSVYEIGAVVGAWVAGVKNVIDFVVEKQPSQYNQLQLLLLCALLELSPRRNWKCFSPFRQTRTRAKRVDQNVLLSLRYNILDVLVWLSRSILFYSKSHPKKHTLSRSLPKPYPHKHPKQPTLW